MFKKLIEKLKTRKLLVVLLLLFFAVNIFAIFNTFTEKTTSTIWDGTVAKKFKNGSGTAVDPYVINDGSELAYFFKVINGEDRDEYYNKYYDINNNINLNGYDFSFADFNKSFSGNLNGNGYTIFNFKISKYNLDTEKDIANYTLFDSLNSAIIKNVNFSDITIEVDGKDILNERSKEGKKTEEKKDIIKEEEKIEEKVEEKIEENIEEKTESSEDTASLIKKYNIKFVQSEEEETPTTTEASKTEETPTVEEPTTPQTQTPTEEEPQVQTEEPKQEEEPQVQEETPTQEEVPQAEEPKQEEQEEETPNVEEEPKQEEETPAEEEPKEEPKKTEKKDYVSKITISLFRDIKQSELYNISVNNINIKYTGDDSKLTSSLFVLNDIENNTIENVNINGISNVKDTNILVSNYNKSTLKNIFYRNVGLLLYPNYSVTDDDTIHEYKIESNSLYFEDEYPVKSALALMNNNSNLKWKLTNNTFKIENIGTDGARVRAASPKRAAPTAHASGTSGTIVYVNDYEADWNYYMGRNYTEAAYNTAPNTNSNNKYGESNLVYIQLNYYARDIDSQYSAAQSHIENFNQYVYYKVYPTDSNGTSVKVPLIDNPFTKRPYNKAFNGWLTDYVGAVIELDTDIYQRYVTIPVTKTNGIPDNININIYATWTNGKLATITSNNNSSFTNAFSGLATSGFHAINYVDNNTWESLTPYYTRNTVTNANYPSGAVDNTGASLTGACSGTCTYYVHASGTYNPSNHPQYYKLDGTMQAYTIQRAFVYEIPVGGKIGGFYRAITLYNNDSFEGYYNSSGVLQTSGTCNQSSCTGYYELIPYYQSDNVTPETAGERQTIYYFTTRDTNIIVLRISTALTRTWSTEGNNKPFTFTSLVVNAQGQASLGTSTSYYFNVNSRTVQCYADTRIENMYIYSNNTPIGNVSINTTSLANTWLNGAPAFVGNGYNTKLGRNLEPDRSNRTIFKYAIGGTTSGISTFNKYKFEVEYGVYSNLGIISRYNSTSYSYYVNAIGVLGNDYDRVTEDPTVTNGTNLEVKYIASGSWSGNIYGRTTSSTTDEILNTTVKSGRFGTNKNDCVAGFYPGGLTAGAHYGVRVATIEGGYIFTVTGGPLSQSSGSNITNTVIMVKGGYQDVIYGGAGQTETYGHKIIQVTGGRVNYSVFGGSNGTSATGSGTSRGTIVGDSLVYIGGSATIGDPSLVNANTSLACGGNANISSVEAGSVFGIGNGRSDSNTIGTLNNSNVVIDGGTINRNVYGGGNFGAVGQNGTRQTYTTKIFIHGGDIQGSVYGGGNNNGGGTISGNNGTTITTNDNTNNITIQMDGGTVGNSVYGGSRTKGKINGNTTVNIYSGIIENDVYGGGEGGGTDGTFVSGNVAVTIGETIGNSSDPRIKGDVYGGSAYGVVNNTNTSTTLQQSNQGYDSTKSVNVTVNNGKIDGSVFGGAKGGNNQVPLVSGNIKVEMKGGEATDVYGGFDQSGQPKNNANVQVVVSGGKAGRVFGGGNQTSINETDVTVSGGVVTTVFGGSNTSGDVNETDVKITGGTVGTVFGGNNIGGTCGDTSVSVSGGTITTAVYGGGSEVATDSTIVSITGAAATIPAVYGGGNKAGVGSTTPTVSGGTSVEINGNVTITNVYGGSNTSGDVSKSEVTLDNGTVTTMYGGNNAGGTTADTNIEINSGNVTTIFGGGDKATSGVTHVVINDTSSGITKVFGGGNEAACTTTNVEINGNHGTIGEVYGGGNKAGATTTNVTTTDDDVTITTLFGGSNVSGNVTTSNVKIEDGNITTVYGGNNAGGQTSSTNIEMDTGSVTTIFGGGNNAISGTTSVIINNTTTAISTIYGGGNEADTGDTSVVFNNGSVNNIFGGGNEGEAEDTTVWVKSSNNTITSVYGGGNKAPVDSTNVTIGTSGGSGVNVTSVYGGSNQTDPLEVTGTTEVTVYSGNITHLYGGNNLSGQVGDTTVTVNGASVVNLYGGGNKAPAEDTEIVVNSGNVIALYGGGNEAIVESTDVTVNNGSITAVFGGGNAAGVTNDTSLKILGGSVANNVYGGGNFGAVGGDTNVLIHNATVYGSAYAGGNGSTATVTGDTTITISGTSVIGTSSCSNYSNCAVFGGGNAAETGTNATPATATVNIIGGTIYGNVYGGANTSKVYGNTEVTIGNGVTAGTNVVKGDVHIRGTVFGGGEANASGSSTYDFSFISVTQGVNIEIDGYGYNNFDIDGSIFGSGNASSSEGASYVTIKNYGTFANPKYNVSLQRANLVTIDNSAIVLSGTTDRTNEYSDVVFSLSRVTELDIKNNTTLFLENGANLLESFKSLNANGTKATATISANGTVNRSTNNRLYMYMGRHLDVAKDQNATDMGEVYGMTFFGMFKYNNDDTVNVGIYGEETAGDDVDWSKVIDNVTSYVAGLHKDNHNIEVDGFYTNFANEETQKYDIDFITPTPPTGPLYMWIIGAGVIEYEVDLNASRYSTLGTTELSLRDFTNPNTTFAILGFDYSELNAGVTLIDKTQVKKIADTSNEADNVMGVSMETSNTGWLNNGQTSFVTDPDDPITGTTSYVGGNSASAPTVLLYLHHSKNIATAGSMGKVKIQLMSIRQTGPLDKETKRLLITLNLSRTLYDVIAYEGSMTAGRKYEMFASTATNISSTSSLSAYYALFATDENIYKPGYHRTLVSTFPFPTNTKITMIDLSGSTPEYFYKVVSASDYAQALQEYQNVGEVSYNVSMFEAMGAENSGVNYDDVTKNAAYYNSSPEYCEEEFIFIIDFGDATITTNQLNNKLLLEMRNSSDATIYSVLAPQHDDLTYNIYANSDAVIDMSGSISSNKIYNGDTFYADLTIDYTQSTVGSVVVNDTHYFDSKLGIKISLINDEGNVVTGTTLLGLYYEIDEARYDPNIDGTTRIKIADKVDSAEKWVIINTGTSAIATGHYKLRFESFGSPDGIYYGLNASDMIEFNIEIINEIYGLDVETTPEEMIINSVTGQNENGENSISYTVFYNSGLTQPNIRFKLYRRNYNSISDTTYSLVDAQNYFETTLDASPNENEYILRDEPDEEFNVEFETGSNLVSGTYKMVFELYDDTALIGTVDKYFIIK